MPIHTFDYTLPSGIRLGCRSAHAPGLRPRALLLHGFPEAAFVWDPVMAELAPGLRRITCLAPNLRGYAPSSVPTAVADYHARHLVADLVALIEAHGAPLDLLVAHDWGGAVAWGLAAQRPDLLRQLLILNSPHPATLLRDLRGSPDQQAASRYMRDFDAPDTAARLAADDFAALWPFFGTSPAWLDDTERQRFRAQWGPGGEGLEGPLNYYRASPLKPTEDRSDVLWRLELPDALVRVNVPTTVLWGERDHALLPGLLDGLEAWVPDLRIERWPDASHWLVHEHPQRVAGVIRRLLDGA